MLPAWFTAVSIIIRLVGGAQYAWGVLVGKAKPNPITWFLMGADAPDCFLCANTTRPNPTGLGAAGAGYKPACGERFGYHKHGSRQHFTPFSITCGVLALTGIVLWQITSVPE